MSAQSEPKNRFLAICIGMVLCSCLCCAPSYYQLGNEAAYRRDYRTAYNQYYLQATKKPHAKGGSDAMLQIGHMYMKGLVNGRKDTVRALEWYLLSARWGNIEAKTKWFFLSGTYKFPPDDLRQQYNRKVQAISNAIIGASQQIADGINQGMAAQRQATYPKPYPPPRAYVQPSTDMPGKRTLNSAKECWTDLDCGFGNKCVKPAGGIDLKGTCVTPVDEFGLKEYNVDTKLKVTPVKGCSFDTDCPIGFECVKKDGRLEGICVKKEY